MQNELDWQAVKHVLLDMDGTLLDLHFDNYFWLELVPQRYAEKQNVPLDVAKAEFLDICQRIEGTLDWYCLDYWTATLGMDIPLLKEEVAHLIAEHPYVIEFLQALRNSGRRAVLVTNAHQKALALKMRNTRLGEHLDHIISSHELGLPKEDPNFWVRLQDRESYHPAQTLLIDDSLPVLRSAQSYGIAHLLAVRCPDSQQPPRRSDEFGYLENFADLIAQL